MGPLQIDEIEIENGRERESGGVCRRVDYHTHIHRYLNNPPDQRGASLEIQKRSTQALFIILARESMDAIADVLFQSACFHKIKHKPNP